MLPTNGREIPLDYKLVDSSSFQTFIYLQLWQLKLIGVFTSLDGESGRNQEVFISLCIIKIPIICFYNFKELMRYHTCLKDRCCHKDAANYSN